MSLTPLEKELLGYVKQLSETSAALEAGLRQDQEALGACIINLIGSQITLIKCVSALTTGSAILKSELQALDQSATRLTQAEKQLSKLQSR